MIPDLSVVWVIVFVLTLAVILDRLLLRPVTRVMQEREGAIRSARELAETMVKLALDYPEYRDAARKVRIVKTTAERYYGRGYQDMQNRVPKIDNTMRELAWRPRVAMGEALKRIYDAYRTDVAEARHLVR